MEFPRLFPPEENEGSGGASPPFGTVDNICAGYAAAYQILERLLRGIQNGQADPDRTMIGSGVRCGAFPGPIRVWPDICAALAQVYRLFRRYFSLSPANYINRVRLQNAAVPLETSAGIRHSHRRCVWL